MIGSKSTGIARGLPGLPAEGGILEIVVDPVFASFFKNLPVAK